MQIASAGNWIPARNELGMSPRAASRMGGWGKLAMFLVCGYSLFGRTFAYIGIPSAKIFIGDVVLLLFLVACTGAVSGPWLRGLLRRTPYSAFLWSMLLFLCWGVVELVRGIALGYSMLTALQNLVFNVYPLYFFLGLWAAFTVPDLLSKTVRTVVWMSCLYGLIYFPLLKQIPLFKLPFVDVELFGPPGGAGMAILGLSYLEKDLRRWWLPLSFSIFLILAGQVRSGWLATIAIVALLSILEGRFRRFVWGAGFVAALLLIGFWTDFDIPSPAGRGGSVSSRELVARAVASVDRDAAREYSSNADMYAGTVSWRQNWWNAIWASVHDDVETAALGHGYGFELHSLARYVPHDVRTPHSVFFYALGYTGWVGVVLFAAFQTSLGVLLWRCWLWNRDPFGLALWLSSLISGSLGNYFETPFGAIPYYLLTGMAAAALLCKPAHTAEELPLNPYIARANPVIGY